MNPFDIWFDIAADVAGVDEYDPDSPTLVTLRLAVLVNDFDQDDEKEPITGGGGYIHEDPIARRVLRLKLFPLTIDEATFGGNPWDESAKITLDTIRRMPNKWVVASNAPRYLTHYASWFSAESPWKVAMFAYSSATATKAGRAAERTIAFELHDVEVL